MQQRWMTFIMLVLLGNVTYFTACNVERLDEDLTTQDILERQNGGCQLVISGHVANTEDLSRLEDVELNSDFFDETIVTDEDGNFRVEVNFDGEEDPEEIEVEVSVDGFLTKTIEVDFSELLANCGFLTEAEWNIGLSPKKPVILLSTTGPTSATINDQYAVIVYEEDENRELVPVDTNIIVSNYSIIFPRVTSINEPTICVSPDNSFARGPGIVVDENEDIFGTSGSLTQDLPLINLVVDAAEGMVLNGGIQLTFTTALPIGNGDIINVNNGLITNFDTANGSFTILVTSLENIEVVNTQGCVIDATSVNLGQQRSRQSLSNCNCGDPQDFEFFDPFTPFETLNIDFPENITPTQAAVVIDNLRDCLNVGGAADETEDFEEGVNVIADKCEVVTLETRNIVRTYRGEILGIPFTYRVSAENETTLTTSTCPTSTACHQGCPE